LQLLLEHPFTSPTSGS